MNTFFSITTILAAIMAVGSIEDCGGHCLGNDNWTMFFYLLDNYHNFWYNDYINT